MNEHAGLHFDEASSYLFDRRLGMKRVAALDLGGFDEYYKYLRFNVRGRVELEEAIEALTTNETYFLRQEYQLTAFRDEVLPKLAQANADKRRLVVWSAGCSTGEEAYSIAAMIHQSGRFIDWDVRVIGSDISKTPGVAGGAARREFIASSAFRSAPTSAFGRTSYFYEREDGAARGRLAPEAACYFGHSRPARRSQGLDARSGGRSCSAETCSSISIRVSRRRVIDNLYERLVPGGYLLLGHSESLLNISTAFELVHLSSDLVYRRPAALKRDPGRRR